MCGPCFIIQQFSLSFCNHVHEGKSYLLGYDLSDGLCQSVFCDSSSRCNKFVCSVWLYYFSIEIICFLEILDELNLF